MESYCRYCYRPIASNQALCSICESERSPRHVFARLLTMVGIAGLPVLIIGVLSLNARLCLAGASVSAAAALFYVYMSTR
jgi:hypothetical protein